MEQIVEKQGENAACGADLSSFQSEFDMVDRKNRMLRDEIERLEAEVREMQGLNRKNQLEIMRFIDISKSRDVDNSNDAFKIKKMQDDIVRNEAEIERLTRMLSETNEQVSETLGRSEGRRGDIAVSN